MLSRLAYLFGMVVAARPMTRCLRPDTLTAVQYCPNQAIAVPHQLEPRQMSFVLTREQLYDLVWSEPMQGLSKQIGISNVVLAKHCRKVGIPVWDDRIPSCRSEN